MGRQTQPPSFDSSMHVARKIMKRRRAIRHLELQYPLPDEVAPEPPNPTDMVTSKRTWEKRMRAWSIARQAIWRIIAAQEQLEEALYVQQQYAEWNEWLRSEMMD